jgi:hypothetical protein
MGGPVCPKGHGRLESVGALGPSVGDVTLLSSYAYCATCEHVYKSKTEKTATTWGWA